MNESLEEARVELIGRKAWALARIGEVINAGRVAGWLNGDEPVEAADADQILAELEALDAQSPMRLLASRLALSPVELDVLWMLATIELEPVLARAARALVSPGMHDLNAQIIEPLVERESEGCDGETLMRLAKLGLIELESDPRVPTYRRAVRVNDRVIELARGRWTLDPEVGELGRLCPPLESDATEAHVPAELTHTLATARDVLVVAIGPEDSGREMMLRKAATTAGHSLLCVRGTALATDADRLARQLRTIARECRLHDAWPLLLDIDGLTDRVPVIGRELVANLAGPLLATSRDACTWQIARPQVTIAVTLPNESQRLTMWRHALSGAGDEVLQTAARRYAIGPELVERAASSASAQVSAPDQVTGDHVRSAVRGLLERRLAGLARRVETTQTWDDLVLPVDQFDLLVELVARVRHRSKVLETWGFAEKVGKGLGLSVLLSGPPGTGKTMIAGLVAKELGLDLYQVDLSRVVSKYIGETEKQLANLFEAAESGHAILLFDEADSLFAKRTEVKSSNDRYANLEVNYLLQRMEAFAGISVLTTNHETAIDKAFLRRLALHVRVPMPDQQERELLWRAMLPARAERAPDLDFASLAASFVMSGGYIKNAVLRAAYLAADRDRPIDQEHLRRAAHAEYEAMGKISFEAA